MYGIYGILMDFMSVIQRFLFVCCYFVLNDLFRGTDISCEHILIRIIAHQQDLPCHGTQGNKTREHQITKIKQSGKTQKATITKRQDKQTKKEANNNKQANKLTYLNKQNHSQTINQTIKTTNKQANKPKYNTTYNKLNIPAKVKTWKFALISEICTYFRVARINFTDERYFT